ncbi:MAG TPA: SDR family oxidoreductase [Gaiellaceae bacterium]|nr:SDR family oxidoreductase [Gaiellaceae bacterium]
MPLQGPDKRALLTGGTGKLGVALADGLREHGWRVVAAGSADADLRHADEARRLVARAVDELGGLDLLVNGAGAGWRVKPLLEVDEQDWDTAFGATTKGTFFVSQAAAPHLRESQGLIVNIEDVAAELAWTNLAAHSAAKAAQARLTEIFARALAPDVRVCGIAPGPVAVDPADAPGRAARTLLGRVGDPHDVLQALLYLIDASYVTGTTITVDGGRRLRTAAPES